MDEWMDISHQGGFLSHLSSARFLLFVKQKYVLFILGYAKGRKCQQSDDIRLQ